MIRLQLQLELSYTVLAPGAEFFFFFHAANTSHQRVIDENLVISQPDAAWQLQESDCMGQRCLRLGAQPGPLTVRYTAGVEMRHHVADPAQIPEVPVCDIPHDVLQYIYPSRYCQSDRLYNFAGGLFGGLPRGYSRAKAICDWVGQHVTFRSNSSDGTTSAVDTLIERVGVCRDFAHLMIALCRAVNMPARFVTGTDFGADPKMGPPDFHAYVEVYLGGRWYLFDPSRTAIPMGMMRMATGRDAADVAFATIFGSVYSDQPRILVVAGEDAEAGWEFPEHTDQAVSTA
ncbi:transglutaminase-like domain-containing protein [Comamonas endophytica]|uniref:Transglutaminase family protein n=1 Tax=Comamonas endophytica TaxID=2949090 RepID=A0ABY6GFJ6_9BURK|nr:MULTISPECIES: transglutaminase family protein [unclassified Acidovorax]MCD2513434.1 transglutaminase family protein [Acidovorax sp. D4N7]UYG53784.1 transglutaminase family protein [Acidovorax sp. 5MLIR]